MDHLYSAYDRTAINLLQFVLKYNYNLDVNTSELGFADDDGTSAVYGPMSGNDSSKLSTFPILAHRPNVYHRIEAVKKTRVIFFAPFSDDVWLALSFVLVTVTFFMTYLLAREARLRHSEAGGHPRVRWDFSEMLLMSVGALCQQGTTLNPRAPSSRIVFIGSFVMAALMYTAYNASIISLTGSSVSSGSAGDPISLRVCGKPDFELDETAVERFKNLYGRNDSETRSVVLSEGLTGVLHGSTVLLADRTAARDYLHRRYQTVSSLCKIRERRFTERDYHRAFPLDHSKYKRIIDHNLLRMREFGLLDRAVKSVFNAWPLCEGERNCNSGAVSIGIRDIYSAFLLLGTGIVASLLLLFLELGFFHCSKFVQRGQRGTGIRRVSSDRWARLKDTILCTKTAPNATI